MENYIKVPVAISGSVALNLGAKMLYGAVAALCNNKGFCWANNAYLAKTLGVTTRSITRYLAQLRDAGLVCWTGADQDNYWARRQIRVLEPQNDDTETQQSHEMDERSYSPDESSYSPDESSYSPDESSYGKGDFSYGADESSYSSDESSYRPDESSYSPDESSYGKGDFSYGADESSSKKGDFSYSPDESSSKKGDFSYSSDERSYSPDERSYTMDESGQGIPESKTGIPRNDHGIPESGTGIPGNDHGIPESKTGIPKSGQDMAASVHPARGRKPKSAMEQVDWWLNVAYGHWSMQERKLVSQTMEEFLVHRKMKGCPIGRGRTLATLCDRVADLGEDNPRAMADVLVWAMLNGWKNLFSIRNRDEMDRR